MIGDIQNQISYLVNAQRGLNFNNIFFIILIYSQKSERKRLWEDKQISTIFYECKDATKLYSGERENI